MKAKLRPLLWPAVFTLIAAAILTGLGIWQLQRLAWKEGILSTIDARAKAPAQPLPPPSAWAGLKPSDYEYRRVTLDGVFNNAKEALIFRTTDAGPGYFVMTPLMLTSGQAVLVNRGYVPADLRDPARREAGELSGTVHLTGLMRAPESRNLFTPLDTPDKGEFFTRDPALIAAHDGLTNAAPFSVDADATLNPGGWPRGGATAIDIPNNHFSYAMTWFGLALGLFGVFFSSAWKRLSEHNGPAAPSPTREIGRFS